MHSPSRHKENARRNPVLETSGLLAFYEIHLLSFVTASDALPLPGCSSQPAFWNRRWLSSCQRRSPPASQNQTDTGCACGSVCSAPATSGVPALSDGPPKWAGRVECAPAWKQIHGKAGCSAGGPFLLFPGIGLSGPVSVPRNRS